MAQSFVPRVWAAIIQSLRPAAQHKLSRCVAESNAKVRPAIVHGTVIFKYTRWVWLVKLRSTSFYSFRFIHFRAKYHSLWSKTREYSSMQSEKVGNKNCGFWQFVSTRSAGEFNILLSSHHINLLINALLSRYTNTFNHASIARRKCCWEFPTTWPSTCGRLDAFS